MAYDSRRHVAVLFGGQDEAGNLRDDTWEWNGSRWIHRAVTGPSPREYHAMAYDSVRGVTVLFGGYTGSTSGETWEWDGDVWTRRTTFHPSPRSNHGMAFDAARGVVVMFGGSGLSGMASTWEWDGSVWNQRTDIGPPARTNGKLAYDSRREVTVLFGGVNGITGVPFGDTWEWDGAVWREVSSAGPSARSSHAMAFDSSRGKTVLFGGYAANARLAETWEWDGTTWARQILTEPTARNAHEMVYDSARHAIVAFGGVDNQTVHGETWEWGGEPGLSWQRRTANPPRGRENHAMVYSTGLNCVLLHGGTRHSSGSTSSETWQWNGTGFIGMWNQLLDGPSIATQHAMAYDSGRGTTVRFGGTHTRAYETWERPDTGDGTWMRRATSGPATRFGHAMVYDSNRRVTVLFGGQINSSSVYSSETWEWDGAVWTLRSMSGPSARRDHAMAFDRTRGTVVLFGGYHAPTNFHSAETWEWDGSAWTLRASGGPAARRDHAMAFDDARGVTVLFGGTRSDGVRTAETWEWSGIGDGTWTPQAIPGPSARSKHAMTYDPRRGVIVLNGGDFNGETWELGAPCTPTLITQPRSQSLCPGRDVTLSTVTTGEGPVDHRWEWQPGGTGSPWLALNGGDNADPENRLLVRVSLPSEGVAVVTLLTDSDVGTRLGVRCRVSNACGGVLSDEAALTVQPCCPADFNDDAFLDFFDYADFVEAFETGAGLEADFNRDGFVDFFDYSEFVQAFETGC